MEKRQQEWQIDINYLYHLDDNGFKFVFDQSVKLLDDTILINNNIILRTTTLITLITGFLVGIIAYTIYNLQHINPVFLQTSVWFSVYLFLICIALGRNFQAVTYAIPGREPKKIMTQINLESYTDKKEIYNLIIFREIDNNQRRIEKNIAINEKRWDLYNLCVYSIIISPIVLIVTYLFVVNQ